jgi:hypothetical protein
VGVTGGIADVGQWGGGVYVGKGSAGGKVDVAGTEVDDGGG